MIKSINIKITKCRECNHVTNSALEHDCAFTSVPHPTVWYCTNKERKAPFNEVYIEDENTIDKYCPL